MSANHSLTSFFARTDRSAIARWWWTVDKPMLVSFIVLMLLGVALVTSASPAVATRIGAGHAHFITRHTMMIIPAFLIMIAVSVMDYRWIRRIGAIVFAGSIFLMVLVPFIGPDIKGAQRWIPFFGFSLQPSEFVKPAFAIMVAWLLSYQKQDQSFPVKILCGAMYILVVILLMSQPDFGMTFVLTVMFAIQIFIAGLPLRHLFMVGLIGIIGIFSVYFTFDHVRHRVDGFVNPQSAAETYQVEKSLEAFANGGFLGKGPGQGTVKNTIPDAHADFIFSVAGEEFGFLFTLGIIGLYAFILIRGFNRIMESTDMFVVLAVGGILSMFGLQALIHMGSSLHLLPTKGMTLPFISYGGSSILAIGLGMGVVLGLTRREPRTTIVRRNKSMLLKGEDGS